MNGEVSVLVVGAGSIGARHARNLIAAGAQVDVMDPDEAKARAITGARAVPYTVGRFAYYGGVVVASPSSFHAEQLGTALDGGAKVLVEKPIALRVADVAMLEGESERVMVGYNLRFYEPVCRLRHLTREAGRIRMARFWFGSYLPDWRPGVDYRTTYSAQSHLGGGVLYDAIHELDLMIWWFGADLAVRAAMVTTIGPLDIDVEDTVKALLQSSEGVIVELSLDYLSRRYRRGIELVGDEATVRLDWGRQVIEVEKREEVTILPVTVPIADSYYRQTQHFLRWLDGGPPPPVDGRSGLLSLGLVEEIRSRAS